MRERHNAFYRISQLSFKENVKIFSENSRLEKIPAIHLQRAFYAVISESCILPAKHTEKAENKPFIKQEKKRVAGAGSSDIRRKRACLLSGLEKRTSGRRVYSLWVEYHFFKRKDCIFREWVKIRVNNHIDCLKANFRAIFQRIFTRRVFCVLFYRILAPPFPPCPRLCTNQEKESNCLLAVN